MTTTAPDPTLAPDPRLPVAAVLSRQLRSTLIAWWSSIVVLFAAGLVVRAWIAEVDSSTWQYAQVAPAVFMLVVGILLPTVFLPMHVGQGVTRRAFTRAAALWAVGAAVAGAVVIVLGFAVEGLVYDAAGWEQAIEQPRLFDDAGQWHLILAQHVPLLVVYLAGGWVIGAAYYRWGWWRGSLAVPLGVVPLFALDVVLGDGFGDALFGWATPRELDPLLVAVLTLVIVAATAAVGAALVRDLPLRRSLT